MLTTPRAILRHTHAISNYTNAPLTSLPFISNPEAPGGKWHVAPVDNFFTACDAGGEYAAHFAQYLKETLHK